MANFFLAKQCILYWLTARHKHGFGIHSPFLFDLITKCFRQNDKHLINKDIEAVYDKFIRENKPLTLTSFGAGSKATSSLVRTTKQIATNEVMPLKYRLLLAKLIRYFKPQSVLELGTSLGITTSYIASNTHGRVVTVEGEPTIYKLAKSTFTQLNLKNIAAVNSSFDDFLANNKSQYDFIVIDGNHTYEATVEYLETLLPYSRPETIWIFDDIYWSAGMSRAWKYIIAHRQITLSIDLCRLGIAFTHQRLSKQHFKIRY